MLLLVFYKEIDLLHFMKQHIIINTNNTYNFIKRVANINYLFASKTFKVRELVKKYLFYNALYKLYEIVISKGSYFQVKKF